MTRRLAMLAAAAVLAVVAVAAPARADHPVQLEAAVDGRALPQTTQRRPARLHPERPVTIELRMTNRGTEPVEVRTVRLKGEVMALTFFVYDTAIGVEVSPGATESRTFTIDLVGLGGQATGLVRGTVAILDPQRHMLASESLVVDVRGSLLSVYGVFGLAVLLLTLLSLGGALYALAHDALPDDRWPRGLRFAAPGVGLGLFVVFTLSALRLFVPRPGLWLPILLVTGGLFFAAGCMTPGAGDGDEEDDDDEDEDDAASDGRAAAAPSAASRPAGKTGS